MIALTETLGGKPALTLTRPGVEMELILDDTKYMVAAVLIWAKPKMHQIEIAYALCGADCVFESDKLAAMWGCWAVLSSEGWAKQKIKTKAPRPRGTKVLFAS